MQRRIASDRPVDESESLDEGRVTFEGGRTAARIENQTPIRLSSPAFENGGRIPSKYTRDGRDISPPLLWSGVPAGTASLAFVVDDPDAPDPSAPKVTWVHWVLYNLPPTIQSLPEDLPRNGLPEGAIEGRNDWNRLGYGGPAPPIGRHRYVHKLYALDVRLPDGERLTKAMLERAMEGHILAKGELVGTYEHA